MFIRSIRPRPATGVGLCLCALLVASGCERSGSEPAQPVEPAGATADTQSVRTFEARGQIVLMPDPSNPATELQIHHEHIPDFVGWDGKLHVNTDGVPGMKAMTMPFTTEPESLLEGLSVGDKVSFTLAMDLERKHYWISSITRLAPETQLDFSDKVAPAPAP